MYKRIITYNFANNDTRDSFVEFLVKYGVEQQPDQSTYAQTERNPEELKTLKIHISNWSQTESLDVEDSVQIYYINKDNTISRTDMRFNRTLKKLK